ncbi:outer membrane protein [Brevundimonas lutea]|uniref:outer membrane protein n=1 Tax=Brevundimonas lutea TaxID=2293980 RepID=UPI001F0C4762|nr:outer membrane beta-barrel protein [Brevundimonas lutea]
MQFAYRKALMGAASLVIVSGFTASAQAQDQDWTGFYAGGHVGGMPQLDEDDETLLFDTDLNGEYGDTVRTMAGDDAFSPGFCGGGALGATPGAGCDEDEFGVEAGVRLGYDRQFGPIVIGGLVEGSAVSIEDSVTGYSTTPASYTATRDLDYLAAVRLRAGYAFGPNLAYATGGYAWGKLDQKFVTSNGANSFAQNDVDDADGWQLGGGVERKVADNLSIGLEYLYTRLEPDAYNVRVGQGSAPDTNPFLLVNEAGTDLTRSNEDFDVQSVRLTAAYRF